MNESMTVLLEDVIGIARQAGELVLEVYRSDFEVRGKDDASPVTEADERAEALILQALATLTPQIPVISEEAAAAGLVPEFGRRFWLVDPLDGTKEFINRNGEFTVNIALIDNAEPVLGVVLAPRLRDCSPVPVVAAPLSSKPGSASPSTAGQRRKKAWTLSPVAPMAMPRRWINSSTGARCGH